MRESGYLLSVNLFTVSPTSLKLRMFCSPAAALIFALRRAVPQEHVKKTGEITNERASGAQVVLFL